MDTSDRSVTVAFEASEADCRLLKRYVQRQSLRSPLHLLAWNLVTMCGFLSFVHQTSVLRAIPLWIMIAGWVLFIAAVFIANMQAIIQRSQAIETAITSIRVLSHGLEVQVADGVSGVTPGFQFTALKKTSDGLYLGGNRGWILIPARAFSDSGHAAAFEEAFAHAMFRRDNIRIPDSQREACPWTVTFQQSKRDIAYAYYHGWAWSFLQSSSGRSALICCLLPLLLCSVLGPFFGQPLGSALLVGGVISLLFTIAILFYLASPAFPVSVVNGRRPIAQPLATGLSPEGIVIDNGRQVQGIAWSQIRKIVADRRSLYFEAQNDLLIIPRSNFLDAAQADEFLAAAQAYQRGETPINREAEASWPPPAVNR